MSSKTKIVVLHMKEIIYTGIFLVLGILLIIFLIILFVPDKNEETSSPTPENPEMSESDLSVDSTSLYIPGIYNTEILLNDQAINVEVIVDQSGISSINLVNISTAVTTMYPLLEPAFNSLSTQIIETQSLDNIRYPQESKYTTLVLLEAIRKSLDKAQP